MRGRVVWPMGPSEAVFLRDGVVDASLSRPRPAVPGDPPPMPGLILPAFADWHFHWVQLGIAGGASKRLLEWLEQDAWPEEERFADTSVCRDLAQRAVRELRSAGTLCGAAYGSPHAASADAFLRVEAASALACGPAVMTRGDPPALVTTKEQALADLERLADVHGARVIVSPRFAPSCDAETLLALGELAARRGLPIQTHLSETEAEVREVRALFPAARDYTDVYDRAGLLGPRTLLGHVIHVSDDELARIAASGAVVVHCPTSNLALGSGRMPLERLRAAGVSWVLGSDVGAGPRLCLLDVLAAALEVHAGQAPLTAVELLHRATVGPEAIFAGGPESVLPPARRPGVLVVDAPDVPEAEDDPEVWIRALVEGWKRDGEVRCRASSWDGRPPSGAADAKLV